MTALTTRRDATASIIRNEGFTLIEVMIVVVILAIVAAFAVPAYADYLTRGKLNAGVAVLKATRARLELAYSDNRSYARADGSCAIASFTDRDSQFAVRCTVSDAGQRFVLTATGSEGASGFTYTLNEAGIESTTAVRRGWSPATLPVQRFILRRE